MVKMTKGLGVNSDFVKNVTQKCNKLGVCSKTVTFKVIIPYSSKNKGLGQGKCYNFRDWDYGYD